MARFGRGIEEFGSLRRKDLTRPPDLKVVFRNLRNHLAGMASGMTRDEALAQEIIPILLCKILDEEQTDGEEIVRFRAGAGEPADVIRGRIVELFERVKSAAYGDVVLPGDSLKLDDESLRHVVAELQNYSIRDADRDAIGDAFEIFIGPALRGSEGQFFTPRNVVKMMIELVDPKPGEKIIDPACGSGGFLISALGHVWKHLREEGERKGWTEGEHKKCEARIAAQCFRGIDKDTFLVKVCKSYMAVMGAGGGSIFCDNSLHRPEEWGLHLKSKITLGGFDVVVTNPPFGAHIPIQGQSTLSQYHLGHRWVRQKDGSFHMSSDIELGVSPQILFVERCVELLRPGGRLAIVLPEGMFGNRATGYILDYLRHQGRIVAIIDCTRKLFQPHTDTKTNVLVFQKKPRKPGPQGAKVFMAIAKSCGHDKRGRPHMRPDGTLDDEISLVAGGYHRKAVLPERLGFYKSESELRRYYVVPRYYSPEVDDLLRRFIKATGAVPMRVEELVDRKWLAIGKGHEIGSTAYGTGSIPFIRTSDISNLEITYDPTFAVSEEIYRQYAQKQDLRPFDVLFVNDGRYRIGNVCLLTEHDTRIVIQSHFRVIRSLDPQKLDPFLLLFLFRHPVVKSQIESKTFIQSTIATIGPRLREIILPIPDPSGPFRETIERLRFIVTERARLRREAQRLDPQEGVDL